MFERIGAALPDDERAEHERTRARLTLEEADLTRLLAEGATAAQEAMIDEAVAVTS